MSETDSDCPICYEPMSVTNSATTPCNHRFHTTCLLQSAMIKRICPYCRSDLTINPPAQHDAPQPVPVPIVIEDRPVIVPERYTRRIFSRSRSPDRTRNRSPQSARSGFINYTDWLYQAIMERHYIHQQPRNNAIRRCGICREEGHDRRSCARARNISHVAVHIIDDR